MPSYCPEGLTDAELRTLALAAGEAPVAVFRSDLDAQLRYASRLLVVTTSTIRERTDGRWRVVPRRDPLEVVRQERNGLCQLRVIQEGESVVHLQHTLARARDAAIFAENLEAAAVLPKASAAPEDDDPEEPTPSVAPLLRLFAFARPRLGAVSLGFGLTLAATAVGLIPPYLTMPLVDRVLVPWQAGGPDAELEGASSLLVVYLGGLAVAAVCAWLLAWAQGAVLARVSELISADLRNRAFSHLTRLNLGYFGGKRTGDLIARISSETDRLCSFLSDTLIDFITDVLMIVGTSIVLFSLDPVLALAALVSFPPIAWLMIRARTSLTQGFLRGGRAWAQMTNILADTIPGIRVVKAFSQEQREVARFERANQRIVEVNNRVNLLWTSFWPLVALLNQFGLLVVWAVGARQVLHHDMTVGALTAFVAYVGRFYLRVESMSRMLSLTQRASAAAQRLFEILDRAPSVLAAPAERALPRVQGEVSFNHVSFRYGNRLVLSDVSFSAAKGKMLGIVGHTGSGKSTIANLVCRFFDPSEGSVTLDGVDVRQLAVEEYRRHIGVVLQDSFLFFGTIADNVAYGSPDAARSRVIEATRAARAHDFVLKLPEAYDSLVGERGQSLSGGERQRIAIARAILIDPQVLVLDEATSSVDVQTEREIQAALDTVTRGRTTIAIAHRLSTLRKADLLIVLKEGKVVETGSHVELLARDGEYARLCRVDATTALELGAASTPPAAMAPQLPLGEPALGDEAAPTALQLPEFELAALALVTDDQGELFISLDGGARRLPAIPRRCFPLSCPNAWLSLLDEKGRELLCIEDPERLSAASQGALERALARTEFLPRIERIRGVVSEATRSRWSVLTDRGSHEFVVDQEDHIRRLDDGRHLIRDVNGMLYLLDSPERLDAKSRHELARFA